MASEQEIVARQYALFTFTQHLSNLIVTNPVLGKTLEHPPLTRYFSDVGQVRWKMYNSIQFHTFCHLPTKSY